MQNGEKDAQGAQNRGSGPSQPGSARRLPPISAPKHTIQAYLLPELPSQAQSGGVAAATALRSRGCDSLSPRVAPGGQQEGDARAAPGNRPSAGEGARGRLRSGTRQPLRQYQARGGRREKNNKETLGSKKSQRNHSQAPEGSPQNAAGSRGFALFLQAEAASGCQIRRQHAGTAPSWTRPPHPHPPPRRRQWELAGLGERFLEKISNSQLKMILSPAGLAR